MGMTLSRSQAALNGRRGQFPTIHSFFLKIYLQVLQETNSKAHQLVSCPGWSPSPNFSPICQVPRPLRGPLLETPRAATSPANDGTSYDIFLIFA